MVIKKSIFYVLLVSGLISSFQAKAMEAGQGLTRAGRSQSDPGLATVAAGTFLVSFGPAALSTDDCYDNWGDGEEQIQREPSLLVSFAAHYRKDKNQQVFASDTLGRRAGRVVGNGLKKFLRSQKQNDSTEKPGQLGRAGRSQSDPAPFSPFANTPLAGLKGQVDACQLALREKEAALLEAAEAANGCFEAELTGPEGDEGLQKNRRDAVAKRERLQLEVKDARRQFEDIAAMKFRLNFALLN